MQCCPSGQLIPCLIMPSRPLHVGTDWGFSSLAAKIGLHLKTVFITTTAPKWKPGSQFHAMCDWRTGPTFQRQRTHQRWAGPAERGRVSLQTPSLGAAEGPFEGCLGRAVPALHTGLRTTCTVAPQLPVQFPALQPNGVSRSLHRTRRSTLFF